MARLAVSVCVSLLLAGGCVAERHPKVTLVSATTVAMSAGIGLPLSHDCSNATSTCSGRYTASVFGLGAAVGLGLGLFAVHELDRGDPAPPAPALVEDTGCARARGLIRHHVAAQCADPAAIAAIHRECGCENDPVFGVSRCWLDTAGICDDEDGHHWAIGAGWARERRRAIAEAHAAAAASCRAAGGRSLGRSSRCRCGAGEAPAGCFCVATAACSGSSRVGHPSDAAR
jgi:hypothetical protein